MKILSVNPTIYFVRNGSTLRHRVVIEAESDRTRESVPLSVRWGDQRDEQRIAGVTAGPQTITADLPDIRQPLPVEITLGDASWRCTWKPVRHWTVHLTHGSHHDVGYTDLPSRVVREHVRFLDDVLDYCTETDAWDEESRFRFVIEQAWSAMAYVAQRPAECVERLMARLREGRLELNAFFANQITELCSHEELLRLLYPSYALKRRYGVPIRSAELNDIPGLAWGLVSAMTSAGVQYFVPSLAQYFRWGHHTVHTFWDEETLFPQGVPALFWWEGPDRSRVLFYYHDRGAGYDNDWSLTSLAEYLMQLERAGHPYTCLRHAVGGGRDNSPPQIEFATAVRDWNAHWAYPRVQLSTNSRFFEDLLREVDLSQLPVHRGDLTQTDYHVGSTCSARETGANRTTHGLWQSAETVAALSSALAGYDYPSAALAEACEAMLLYDEHTWGMAHPVGPAQDAHFAQKAENAHRAAALSHDVLLKGLNRLADQVRLEGDSAYLLVYNPTSLPRTDLVRVQLVPPDPASRPMAVRLTNEGHPKPCSTSGVGRALYRLPHEIARQGCRLFDVETGTQVPCQLVELDDPLLPWPDAPQRYGLAAFRDEHRFEVLFVAEQVPAHGYRVYGVEVGACTPVDSDLRVGRDFLENRFYRVEIDPHAGVVRRLWDKVLKRELVDAAAPYSLGEIVGRDARTAQVTKQTTTSISMGLNGPLAASVRIRGTAPGCPQCTLEITLYRDLRRVDISVRLLKDFTPYWELYIAFPFFAAPPRFMYEGPLAVLEPLRDQLPGTNSNAHAVQRWADVGNPEGTWGITWSSVEAPIVTFGGLWPGYVSQAHHGATPPGFGLPFLKPGDLTCGHLYSYVASSNYRTNFQPCQVGDMLFRYSLTSHDGDWRNGAAAFGAAIHQPLVPVPLRGPQTGTLPPAHRLITVDAPNVELLTLKRAEDGRGYIVRLFERTGQATTVRVEIPWLAFTRVYCCTSTEENSGVPSYDQHSFTVAIPAFGVATVRVMA